MSVTFTNSNRCGCLESWSAELEVNPSCAVCRAEVNLCNRNAADLLTWLDLPVDELYGEIEAQELEARCRRRLWPEARNHDSELAPVILGPRAEICGRRPGYLREKCELLLALASAPGAEKVRWS